MPRKAKPLEPAPHRIIRDFTPEELARWKQRVKEADLEKDELIAEAKAKIKEAKRQQ